MENNFCWAKAYTYLRFATTPEEDESDHVIRRRCTMWCSDKQSKTKSNNNRLNLELPRVSKLENAHGHAGKMIAKIDFHLSPARIT